MSDFSQKNMEIIERIQQIIDHENLNISSFAKKIGVVDQTIRGIVIQKRNKPGYDLIVKILQTFNWVDPEWLILGKGEIQKANKGTGNSVYDTASLKELIDYLKEKDDKIEKLIEEKTELKIKYNMIKNEKNIV
jgi:plasmid maintenance system antidote protein VapI